MGIIEYLNENAIGYEKRYMIYRLCSKYKLNYKDAKKIYEQWRHGYVTGVKFKECKADKGKSIMPLSEKIKAYSKRNGISKKEIYRYIKLRKEGIFDSNQLCEEFGLTKAEQIRLYVFLKQYDVLDGIEKR